jgi:hypothetical protein
MTHTLVLLLALGSSDVLAQQPAAPAPQCRPAGATTRVAELREASGIAVSRRVPGRLWAHNDSGEPVLFALDARGSVTGRLRLTGAAVEDWEAVAVGPCPGGSCVYVGDIGDNDAARARITVYRVPEPPAGTVDSAQVNGVFHATYPDGAHDAEALLITPDGTMFVVTKGDTGPVAVYRFPRTLTTGATVRLERVGAPREAGRPGRDDRITDGSVSPDGTWTVLRTTGRLSFYRTTALLAGQWREERRIGLKDIGEPQGEGVAFGADNSIYVAGEGGGKSRSGTFARLTCTALWAFELSPPQQVR